MKATDSSKSDYPNRGCLRRPRPLLHAGLALALTLLLFAMTRQGEETRLKTALARTTAELGLNMERRLGERITDLKTVAVFIEANGKIGEADFRNLTGLLNATSDAPSYAWIPDTAPETRVVHEDPAVGFARITLVEENLAEILTSDGGKTHLPVYLLPPLPANPARRDFAARRAGRDPSAGSPAAKRLAVTVPDELPWEWDREADLLLMMPVSTEYSTPDSGSAPAASAGGFVLTPLSVGRLLEGSVLSGTVEMRVYDQSLPPPRRLLYSTVGAADGGESPTDERLRSIRTFSVAGHSWRIECSPNRLFLKATDTLVPETLLGGGVLLSGLLAFYLHRLRARSRKCLGDFQRIIEENEGLRREREERQNEAGRSTSEGRSALALLESMPHAAAICNGAGIVTFINPACDRLFRLDKADARGMPLWVLAADEQEREELKALLKRGLDEGERRQPRAIRVRCESGRLRPFRINLTPLPNQTGFAVVLTDLSDLETEVESAAGHRRNVEWQLQEKSREVEMLRGRIQRPGPSPAGTEPVVGKGSPGKTTSAGNLMAARRILVVEDNPVNRQVAEAMLGELDLLVETAGNGREAIDRLTGEPFDLVLMDCQMPGMDGYEATRQIRLREAAADLPPLPIIAMTAHAFEDDRERCLQAGMNDYLSKPFNLTQLREILYRWIPASGDPVTENDLSADTAPARLESGGTLDVLDRDVLEKLKALERRAGRPFLMKIISLYLDDAPGLLQALDAATREGRRPDAAAAAHALKSSSANVGAMRLSKLCRELEQNAVDDDAPPLEGLAEGISAEFDRVRTALQAIKDE